MSAKDKKTLDQLAKDAVAYPSYMIEIAGYAASTGTKELNQKLSHECADAIITYLCESDNAPMRRFLVPAGYGASHFVASNADVQVREDNQRVDMKVIVNKGLAEGEN